MLVTINPFVSGGFNVTTLTKAINILPNRYGRLEELGLMRRSGITTRTVMIEEQHGVLSLLPTKPVGSPGTPAIQGKRKMRTFTVPHIPHDDFILPSELQNIRAFGSDSSSQGLATLIGEKLQNMRNKHAITLEHLRMGALKGIILDADGSTLYNLYTEFDITPKTINFALGSATTNILGKCLELKRHLEVNLKGEVSNGAHCFVSEGFFDSLVNHAKVIAAYERWHNGAALRGDYRKGFEFGGIIFEEYRGTATDGAGTDRPFIAANEGHAFPTGTMDAFKTFFAPADFNEAVNTMGLPIYVKSETARFDRGVELHSQSNPLPMCLRPGLLVKVTAS